MGKENAASFSASVIATPALPGHRAISCVLSLVASCVSATEIVPWTVGAPARIVHNLDGGLDRFAISVLTPADSRAAVGALVVPWVPVLATARATSPSVVAFREQNEGSGLGNCAMTAPSATTASRVPPSAEVVRASRAADEGHVFKA